MRRLLPFALKAAVSGLLLYLALNWANIGMVGDRLSRLNLGWVALGLLVLLLQIVVLAVRWRQIILQCGVPISLAQSYRYCMVATFFNQALPSSVGGDAARIWMLARQGAGWSVATYSVLVDRVVGVVALATLVIVCLPWSYELVRDPVGRVALLVIGFGSIIAGGIFTTFGWQRLRLLQRWTVTRHLAAAATVALRLLRSLRTGGLIAVLSAFIHLLTVLAAWCAAKAVAAPLDFAKLIFLDTQVRLVSILPV